MPPARAAVPQPAPSAPRRRAHAPREGGMGASFRSARSGSGSRRRQAHAQGPAACGEGRGSAKAPRTARLGILKGRRSLERVRAEPAVAPVTPSPPSPPARTDAGAARDASMPTTPARAKNCARAKSSAPCLPENGEASSVAPHPPQRPLPKASSVAHPSPPQLRPRRLHPPPPQPKRKKRPCPCYTLLDFEYILS